MTASMPGESFLILPPADEVAHRWAERLAREVPDLDVVVARDENDAASVLAAGCRAAYGTLTPGLLAAATELRWLQAPAAGPAPGFYFPALVAHPVTVTNLRGTYTEHVATHTVALVFALARNIPYYVRMQEQRSWAPLRADSSIVPLAEATIAIVGFGAIGARAAELLRPLGCTIVAVDAHPEVLGGVADAYYMPDQLDIAIADADIVILTVPHTPQTHHLWNAPRFGAMKRGASLVNVGRGSVVDMDALIGALDAGTLRSAGLDVYPDEPLPPDHLLWGDQRVLMTPHVASVGPGNDDRRFEVLRENAESFLRDRPLRNVVDKERGF